MRTTLSKTSASEVYPSNQHFRRACADALTGSAPATVNGPSSRVFHANDQWGMLGTWAPPNDLGT